MFCCCLNFLVLKPPKEILLELFLRINKFKIKFFNFKLFYFVKEDDEDDEEDETVSRVPRRSFDRMESAVDITEKFVFERLKEPRYN